LVPDLIDPTEEMKEKAYKILDDLEKSDRGIGAAPYLK
jgi:hypothetical protein